MSSGGQPSGAGIAVASGAAGQPSAAAGQAGTAELAGWWPRAGALLIDGLLLSVVNVPVSLMIGLPGSAVVNVGIACLYAGVLMSRSAERNGQTVGKQVVGLRVVADDGPISFGRAVVRDGLFKGLLSLFTLGLDYLWPLWDSKRQALHDKAVATYVVRASHGRSMVGVSQAAATAPPTAWSNLPPPADRSANWLPDPRGEARLRYWDGTQWTDHTAP